jgi:hypothetical protein
MRRSSHILYLVAPKSRRIPAIDQAHLALLTRQAEFLETAAGDLARAVPARQVVPAGAAGIAAAAELGNPPVAR